MLESISGATAALRAEATYADVLSLRVKGESGFVIYSQILPTVDTMRVAKEDGVWKISSAFPRRLT